jgi:hypothetical protein
VVSGKKYNCVLFLSEQCVNFVTRNLTHIVFCGCHEIQFSVEEFEESVNPDNAKLVVMKKRCFGGHRWYELDESNRKALNLPDWCTKPKNVILHNLEAQMQDEECTKD